ncbi:MAG: HDIG domain-containing protein [Bacteroidia bacterium]|nr:HDIG domain-containing protein [Bacteroidia bacterium]MDW8347841.1 HDIG domain-containing protein [Bacteroidia bacterium]
MEKQNWFGKVRRRVEEQRIFYKWGILVGSVIVTVVFMPRKNVWDLSFQEGSYWKSKDIIAPFDFAVEKTSEEIQSQKQKFEKQILKTFDHDSLGMLEKLEIWQQIKRAYPDLTALSNYGINLTNSEYQHCTQDKSIISVIDQIMEEYHRNLIFIDQDKSEILHSEIILREKDKYEQIIHLQYVIDKKEKAAWLKKQIRNRVENLHVSTQNVIFKILDVLIVPNYFYNSLIYEKERASVLGDISIVKHRIEQGKTIIKRGELITPEKYSILKSFQQELKKQKLSKNFFAVIIGQFILVAMGVLVIYIYLLFFNKEVLERTDKTLFLYITFALALVIMSIFDTYESYIRQNSPFTYYVVPLCIIPIVLTTFYNSKISFVCNATYTAILGIIIQEYEFLLVQFVAGAFAALGIVNVKSRSQFFKTSIYIFITYILCYFAFLLITGGDLKANIRPILLNITLNAFLTLLAYPIIWAIEKLFGFVSDIKLLELSDTNHPLLKLLALKAPGTFQHSMQVANLAEAASDEIGADSLLARVGALYHDIGKIKNPKYFAENQKHGENPHIHLTPEESANIIIRHVSDGAAILREHHFPKEIKDFVYTHHGTTRVEVFYQRYLEQNNGVCKNEDWFRYSGPLPTTKEMVIVMLSDSIEASSRSLDNPTKEEVTELVNRIIKNKLKENQLVESNLTYAELESIRKVFVDMLLNILHVRDKYPTLEVQEEQ